LCCTRVIQGGEINWLIITHYKVSTSKLNYQLWNKVKKGGGRSRLESKMSMIITAKKMKIPSSVTIYTKLDPFLSGSAGILHLRFKTSSVSLASQFCVKILWLFLFGTRLSFCSWALTISKFLVHWWLYYCVCNQIRIFQIKSWQFQFSCFQLSSLSTKSQCLNSNCYNTSNCDEDLSLCNMYSVCDESEWSSSMDKPLL
jgi:hypothetical protein